MLTFKKVTAKSICKLRKYYSVCNFKLCDYSIGTKLLWKGYYNASYAEFNDCLIIREDTPRGVYFNYPVPLYDECDIEGALNEIEKYCMQKGIRLCFAEIPGEKMAELSQRYIYYSVENQRRWRDYIYYSENMQSFSGRKYSGQRNHINKFKKLYPGYIFREIRPDDADKIAEFWNEYDKLFAKDSIMAKKELASAKEFMNITDNKHFCKACIEYEGKIIGVTIGEICGNTMIIHIEKALYNYEGVYTTLVNEFAKNYCECVKYINREDDACDKGLRTSKMQYQPIELGKKFVIKVNNDAEFLEKVPVIKTSRLTLNAIEYSDAKAYTDICIDDDLNKYWGYDYKKDLKGELTPNYFVDVCKHDFEKGLAINFAIRLNKKFIGEVVIYNYDFRGGAEIGVRIAKKYSLNGYGKESFDAAANWALYSLGLTKVVAKCYKENHASYKMLSALMKQVGEDETFYYFERLV